MGLFDKLFKPSPEELKAKEDTKRAYYLIENKKWNQLAKMGFASGDAAIKALGFKGALDKITKSAGNSKSELKKLFKNSRAVRGILSLTGKGAKDFNNVLNQIKNSSGATQKAFEKQELTLSALKNQFEKFHQEQSEPYSKAFELTRKSIKESEECRLNRTENTMMLLLLTVILALLGIFNDSKKVE